MQDKSIEVFEKAPVHTAVLKNALPAMIAMLMVLVYNLADTFFIGQTRDAFQVAAVSLGTPVFLIFMSLGTAFGIGGTSVISRALGEGRKEYAQKVSAFCMWGCVAVGIVVMAMLLIFMNPILLAIGASADTWEYAKSYLSIVALCGPFVTIGNCFSNVVRAEGEAGKAMTGMLIGNILNIILDPIMILGFGWGITGAAAATVIGNICGTMYYILYLAKGKSLLSISIRKFTFKEKVCSSVLAIGIPAALGTLLMSVSQIIINKLMAGYGDMAIAGIGVAMKVLLISGMFCMGLGQGIQPVLGYCFGAKLWERFKQVLKFSLIFGLVLSVLLTGLCYLFLNQMVSGFLTDTTAYEYAVQFAKILLSTSWLFGVFFVFVNTLQAMGAATASLIINISRQGLIYIPALFILNAVFGLNGLVWAQPVADVLSLLIAVILYLRVYKKLIKSYVA